MKTVGIAYLTVVALLYSATAFGQDTSAHSLSGAADVLPSFLALVVDDDLDKALTIDPRWVAEEHRIGGLPSFEREGEQSKLRASAARDFYILRYAELASYALLKPKVEFLEVNAGRAYYKLIFSPDRPWVKVNLPGVQFVKERILSVPLATPEGSDAWNLFPNLQVKEDLDKFGDGGPEYIESITLHRQADGMTLLSVKCNNPDFAGSAMVNGQEQRLLNLVDKGAYFLKITPGDQMSIRLAAAFGDGKKDEVSFTAKLPQSSWATLHAEIDHTRGSRYARNCREMLREEPRKRFGDVFLDLEPKR